MAMLFQAGMTKGFWAEAVNYANYLRNRLPTATHGKTRAAESPVILSERVRERVEGSPPG